MTNIETPTDVITRVFASLELEHDRNAYVLALRSRGWTLDPIARASGLTRVQVRRLESISSRSDQTTLVALDLVARGIPLPAPDQPVTPAYHQRDSVTGRSRTHAPDPSPETIERLLILQPLAHQVRSFSPRYRREAEEYTALLNHAITVEGTTVYRLAKLLKVTHAGLYARLTRYGYRPRKSNSRTTIPIRQQNRYTPAE